MNGGIPFEAEFQDLVAWMHRFPAAAIAVSGGVDSLSLGTLYARIAGCNAQIFHAISPAVPKAATKRVLDTAVSEGWRLKLINAGEFNAMDYIRNPVNRCYHCKSNLYKEIANNYQGLITSGTNTDDLKDFRPGLGAAAELGVRHPFAECNMNKVTVRRLAKALGYPDIATLPASPCLSSRITTGIPITPVVLHYVEAVELELSSLIASAALRCRIRPDGVEIQVEPSGYLTPELGQVALWNDVAKRVCDELCVQFGIQLTYLGVRPYVMGSAFVTKSDRR